MKNCYYSKYEPIFGSWYITEEIGAGAEGKLYRVSRKDALGNEYTSALKAISIPAGGERELESMMAGGMPREEAEAFFSSALEDAAGEFELLAKLKGNSYIASYEDHEIYRRDEGFGWDILIRMEELEPLVRHSIDSPLTEEDVIRMGSDICRGLILCRKMGIIHRDIKPDNIFISPGGNYKLGDFGIARIIENTTAVLSRKGTYEYMAPEVYWGREYGQTADIYSLGMVMYRYLNDGRMPFMPAYPEAIKFRDSETAFLKRISEPELPPPANGSEELARIVLKACAHDRKDRYTDAESMLEDLEALASKETKKISAPRIGASGRRKARTRLKRAAAVFLVLAAAAGIAAWALIPREVTDITGIDPEITIYIGDDKQLEYAVEPEWFKDEPVTFSSGDGSVFTVDGNGLIHAESVGESVLTVSAKEYTEEAVVSIVPKVTEIGGIDSSLSLTTGNTLTLEPVLKPDKFASEPVSYSSSDNDVAKVSDKGKITAVSAGTADITVSAGGCTFETKVTVSDPVVYSAPAKKNNKKTKKSSSSGSGNGYFGDEEYF